MLRRSFTLLLGATLLLSCNKDNDKEQGSSVLSGSKYIIAATPEGTQGVADYLITADDLTQGSVTTRGNGIEQDGTWRYYVTHNNNFYSLLYGQGNPGAVTAYNLISEGKLNRITNFQSETVASFGIVQNDILMVKISRNASNVTANWYRLGTAENHFIGEGTIDQKALANKPNGELAYFIMPKQVGNKVFLPYFTIYGDRAKGTFSTAYPDEANIAVYSYPDMRYEKTITTDKISFIGRYFTDGIALDEKGDAYAFSSSIATSDARGTEISSTKPSAFIRIKRGTTEVDDSYFFNIENATEGQYYITDQAYTKDGKLLGFFNKKAEKGPYKAGTRLAVVDLYNQNVTWIEGLPEASTITQLTQRQCYISEDKNTVSIGVVTATEGSYVYNINMATAKATKGLKVEGGKITGISKLIAR